MRNCPECGEEVDEQYNTCPQCGYEIGATIKICPECGERIDINTISCPSCGFQISNKQNENNASISKRKKTGMIFCIVAILLIIIGLTRITNSKYRFYKEHYAECEAGYIENKALSNSYSWSLLKSGYSNVANGYQNLMEEDKRKIASYRIQALIFCGVGISFIIIGTKKIK